MRIGKDVGDTSSLWSLYINLLYALVIGVILLLGYLTLQSDIRNFLNRKVYSPEEVAALQKKAKARVDLRLAEKNWNRVEDGIHIRTGLRDDDNLPLIISSCTPCHSAKLITQNTATRDGWKAMIRWMQETQGLGQLGKNEPRILNYLAEYYAPVETGRRKILEATNIEWYDLEIE